MDKCQKMALLYLSALRAIYQIHQNNHWLTKGDNFYGNHLLFQRLYESAQENIDAAAEKLIGIFGREILPQEENSELITKIVKKYSDKYKNIVEMSLAIESDFLKIADKAYECFESEKKLTLGLDDMLCAISDDREEAVYLLSSVLDKQIEKEAILNKLNKIAKLQKALLKKL